MIVWNYFKNLFLLDAEILQSFSNMVLMAAAVFCFAIQLFLLLKCRNGYKWLFFAIIVSVILISELLLFFTTDWLWACFVVAIGYAFYPFIGSAIATIFYFLIVLLNRIKKRG